MSGTLSNSPTACFIDAAGIHAPAFTDILSYLQTQARTIFGNDIYLGNDSQDGQMLGIFATAIFDTNSMAIAVYNSYSPSTAQGVGLSSVVKINGISRLVPTKSTVDLTIVGIAGTIISNGIVRDQSGNNWLLPTQVVIPFSGQTIVTAIAQNAGDITVLPNTVTEIATPTRGWQQVTNATAVFTGAITGTNLVVTQVTAGAIGLNQIINGNGVLPNTIVTAFGTGVGGPGTYQVNNSQVILSEPMNISGVSTRGSPLETDFLLRQRQTRSTMLPSVTALDGMIGSVADVTGVTRYAAYENDTNQTDANGIPGHSVSFVVEGGDSQLIANAIAAHKTPGAGTFGTTVETVIDPYNVPHSIRFFRPQQVVVTVQVHLTALTGYTSDIGFAIVNTVINYILANPIGSNIYLSKITGAANLTPPTTSTFNITSIVMAASGGTPTAADVIIPFNSVSFADTTTVTVSIP